MKNLGVKIKNGFKKIIDVIKKKWLISGTLTALLILIFVAVFILITVLMQKLDLKPIDLTADKTFTLSDESKEKVKDIEANVNVYFIGYDEEDSVLILAKQYKGANENINVEAINIDERADLAQKYGISSGEEGIIVENGDKSKVISASDLYSYDSSTGSYEDLTENKLTSAIISVTTDNIPNVYFLKGFSEYSLTDNMYLLSAFLKNEIMEIKDLDLVTKKEVPSDCKTLVITTPNKDFSDAAANEIIKYINKGGNILWFNAALGEKKELPNVNKVLASYGVQPFEVGYIFDTDSDNTVSGAPYIMKPETQYTDITREIFSKEGTLLYNCTKINLKDEDALEEMKIEKEDLLITSDSSYFRTDWKNTSEKATDSDKNGAYIVGTKLTKTIKEDIQSKLIIFGENNFITDYTIDGNTPYVAIYNNKDVALNSMVYLAEREGDISVRKTTEDVKYTATDKQDVIIKTIIFSAPLIIIAAGIVVWQHRRRKR